MQSIASHDRQIGENAAHTRDLKVHRNQRHQWIAGIHSVKLIFHEVAGRESSGNRVKMEVVAPMPSAGVNTV